MFWRVYRHGLFLLFAVALTMVVLGWASRRRNSAWSEGFQLMRILEVGGRPLLADQGALDRILHRASEKANADVSLYSDRGMLLGSNVDPPLPPVDLSYVRRVAIDPGEIGRRGRTAVVPIRQGHELLAYAVVDWRGPGPREFFRWAAVAGGVLAVLALASIPLVRGIVAPLERLTGAVRAFGEGDLSVRSGLRRSDEVGELARAFDEMAERMEKLVRNERELLANVSHELRTPLSRIRVALELAAEGDAERARKYLSEIGSDMAELERLIEDVLTAARLDANKGGNGIPIHKTAVSGSELVQSALRRFREAWPTRPVVEDVAPDLPAIDADPVLIRRVLDNLLDNARKYSEDSKPIVVRARSEDSVLKVEVADEGIGMSREDLGMVFTPFFRTDRSRARGTGGVGLGLTLAKRIVDAHGGTITASSEPGRGSSFTVSLPLPRTVPSA